MEYKIIQILSITNDEGDKTMTYLPTIIDSNDIIAVTPLMSKSGKLYKNVSVLECYGDRVYTAFGKYDSIKAHSKPLKVKGFQI